MRREKLTNIPNHFEKQTIPQKEKILNKEYHFELITPMFGGDSESWKLDTKNPVRGQAVKGQLRYWWRTMQNETDFKQLLYKESQRWGGKVSDDDKLSNIKSPVSIAVIEQKDIKTETIKANEKGNALGKNSIPGYVLFPVTQNIKNGEKIYIITQLKFTLLISYPEKYQKEVTNTLILWALFGGVGARTRRGTGSLYCAELMKSFTSKTDIKNFINELSSEQMQARDYARLTGSQLFINDKMKNTPIATIWFGLLKDYGNYRQDRKRKENSNGHKKPGRSFWPEPDAIRKITHQSSPTHKEPVNTENWFPRAAFGLPILTTFTTQGDPTKGQTIHLEPDISVLNKSERYPSPMILKVIKLNDGQVFSCCFVLNQNFPEQLKLIVGNKEHRISGEQLPFSKTTKVRKMKTNNPLLENNNIYQHLADFLELKEVK